MPRRANPGESDDSPSKENSTVQKAAPKLTEGAHEPEHVELPSSKQTQYTKYAVKEAWHDLDITIDIANTDLARHDFARIYAVEKTFSKVDFTHSNFTNCYFHACKFVDCDFTGVVFKEANFTNSTFEGCRFEYTIWDKTHITPDILDNCLPSWENVAYALARLLRANFTQIGNLDGINKAAALEVQQKGRMLYDAAFSNKRYYRERSKGFSRILDGLRFFKWKIQQYIWGNGESPANVLICAVGVVVLSGIAYFCFNYQTTSFWNSLILTCAAFWGVSITSQFTVEARLALTIIRYVLFALFMAALIRRLSRR